MTNKERAQLLTSFDIKLYEMHKDTVVGIDEMEKEKYELALEMAEWKDQQFKEYLEFRKIECLRTAKIVYAYDMSSAGELEIKAKCYDEIINEFFKEN